MGLTMAEKILSQHSGRKVKPGEIILAKNDTTMSHDANNPSPMNVFQELGGRKLFKPDRVFMVIDHMFPAANRMSAHVHNSIRGFCQEYGCRLYDGQGICHVVLPENGHVLPGNLIIGTDSHTCSYGALGAFSTGVGSTDMGVALMTGELWFMVPETIRMNIVGDLPAGVFAKDIILHIIATLTADGATYKAVEFAGPVIEKLSMDGRLTICNMSVEMGAKAGMVPPDELTINWVKERTQQKFQSMLPDPDAHYCEVLEFNVSQLPPFIAKPHRVDQGVSLEEVLGTKIHQANLTSCTAARMEDLRVAANILAGRKVAKDVKMLVVPGSRKVLQQALEEGIIDIFVKAGCHIGPSSCGGCAGETFGAPDDGEAVITTANRNFKGRLGNPNAFIWLASPATVAASAIEGKISDPRQYFS